MAQNDERADSSPPEPTTYLGSVEAFVSGSDWLSLEHAIPVMMLRKLAVQLDDGAGAATAGQFGLTYRNLIKLAPGAGGDPDEVDLLLDTAESWGL